MKVQKSREVPSFLAAAVFFFICMLVLNPQYIPISSHWDHIVLHLLTFMSGLGLCLVLGLLVKTLWRNRALLRNGLHDSTSEEVI